MDESALGDTEEFVREELVDLLAAEYELMNSKLDELDNDFFSEYLRQSRTNSDCYLENDSL